MGTPHRLETVHLGWINHRAGITAADASLTDSTKQYVDIPVDSFKAPRGMNSIELRFLADAADKGATILVYAARKSGDVALVASLAVTSGLQEVTIDSTTYYFVDTIVVTNYWMKDVKVADADGNDGQSRVGFDLLGYDEVFCLITSALTDTWRIDITGF